MGRIARSWMLTRQSYRVLMMDKELLLLPVLSGLAMLVICGTFVAGIFLTGFDPERLDGWLAIPSLLFYILSYTAAFFFQAALIAGALQRMNGGDPTVASSLRAALHRFGSIVVWGVIAGTVGMILRSIQERSALAGRIVAGLLGVGWSLATWFLVPVIVMEDHALGASFRRSAALFRQTWGETLAGNAGVGLASFFVMLPIVGIGVGLGVVAHPLVGVAVAVPLLLLAMVFFAALQGVYVAALYRYATTGESPEQFDDTLIQGAFQGGSGRR